MIYRLLADGVMVVHLGFVVFVMTGGVLALAWRPVMLLHVPAAVWGFVVQISGWRCPLTPLENHFRALSGQAGYAGGFIEHYLLAMLYPDGLTREIQIVLALLVLTVNAAVYSRLLAPRQPRGSQLQRG